MVEEITSKYIKFQLVMMPLEHLNVLFETSRSPRAEFDATKARGMRPIFQSSEGSDTKNSWKFFVQLIFGYLDLMIDIDIGGFNMI